jgi:hypothetical protein
MTYTVGERCEICGVVKESYKSSKNIDFLEKEKKNMSYKAQQGTRNLFLVLFIVGIMAVSLINFSSATITQLSTSDKPFAIGQNINLLQTCSSCTYNNISSVEYPDGTYLISPGEYAMTRADTTYNYSVNGTLIQMGGTYIVNGHGDIGGTDTPWNYTFVVGNSSLWFFIVVLVVAWFAGAYGLSARNGWFAVLGGLGMMAVSTYVLASGISIWNDLGTKIIGMLSFGAGFLCIFRPLLDEIQANA